MISEYNLSQRAACRVMDISRTSFSYQPDRRRDEPVIKALIQLAAQKPTYGFGLMFDTLRRQGKTWNHKRVYRIYKLLKLNLRRKSKKRLPSRHPKPLAVPASMNQCWSIDFMSDALMDSRRFRTFNVADDYNREVLAIEVDFNLPAPRVIRVLDRIASMRGYPKRIRLDNGPEFISVILADWAENNRVALDFIQPGKPTQNSFIERFNRTYRTEVLNLYIFHKLSEVKEITNNWIKEYNEERPHTALGRLTPKEYRLNKYAENSNFNWY